MSAPDSKPNIVMVPPHVGLKPRVVVGVGFSPSRIPIRIGGCGLVDIVDERIGY